ncbi:gp49 [Rhodococcus phage ReqiPine5]|uniref:DNA polymerase n=1 Tax=Rhodococcus phage ReqiPine5 TaxID=691963 RepID=D4P824_9CAUD|nr:gp49 [Rhodococcus phage ReqiPine5]ADD81154.1 gp49 [Rhodococcus phage ReqiPine5]
MPPVPDLHWFDPNLNAQMYCGAEAHGVFARTYAGGPVAADIETKGIDIFTIRCITFSWHGSDGRTHGILLDMGRRPEDLAEAKRIAQRAEHLVFHNSPFDVVPLVHFGVMGREEVFRVWDTIVLSRMAFPDVMVPKKLEAMAVKMRVSDELPDGLKMMIKASGLKSKDGWYAHGDIDRPAYRHGAIADTVVTLRLLPVLIDAIHRKLTDHPFTDRGLQTTDEAQALVDREMLVNRVMLWRSARGIRVDLDYMHTYRDSVADKVARAELELKNYGVDPGNGAQLVAKLDEVGGLPENWPRTATGKLASNKDAMEKLGDHPLALAHRIYADETKIGQYLDAVASRAEVTGRCHPSVAILGASATGRTSYSDPPLQQFSADARPVLVDDGQGLMSVDWSAIEPVVVANMAGDQEFLAPFVAGADLYEPIQRAAGIDRKRAKVVLLGTLYGEGKGKMAADLKCSYEQAVQIQRGMFSAMPKVERFLETVKSVAAQFGIIVTADGRILDVPKFNGEVAAYKATNYITQGTAYSVAADTIVRLHDAGLSDEIHLFMHDEFVVSRDAAPDVEAIMQTPPEFMVRWTKGQCTRFRTDSNDLGGAWAYV